MVIVPLFIFSRSLIALLCVQVRSVIIDVSQPCGENVRPLEWRDADGGDDCVHSTTVLDVRYGAVLVSASTPALV